MLWCESHLIIRQKSNSSLKDKPLPQERFLNFAYPMLSMVLGRTKSQKTFFCSHGFTWESLGILIRIHAQHSAQLAPLFTSLELLPALLLVIRQEWWYVTFEVRDIRLEVVLLLSVPHSETKDRQWLTVTKSDPQDEQSPRTIKHWATLSHLCNWGLHR